MHLFCSYGRGGQWRRCLWGTAGEHHWHQDRYVTCRSGAGASASLPLLAKISRQNRLRTVCAHVECMLQYINIIMRATVVSYMLKARVSWFKFLQQQANEPLSSVQNKATICYILISFPSPPACLYNTHLLSHYHRYCTSILTCRTHASMLLCVQPQTWFCVLQYVRGRCHLAVWPVWSWRQLVFF